MLTYLNYFNFNREVILNKKKVVILFGAPWCMSCQELLPLYEKWSEEYKDDYDFKLVDMSKSKYLVKQFRVTTTVTFIVVSGWKEINRFGGIQTAETFKYYLSKEKALR